MGKMKATGHWNYEPRTYAMRASRELRAELLEKQMEENIKNKEKKTLRRSYWWQRLANAMADLRKLDPAGWEAWFDSDAVPDSTLREIALVIEARCRHLAGNRPAIRAIARLYRGVFIWHDQHGYFVFDESKRIFEFATEAEAKGHIDASRAVCGGMMGMLVGRGHQS